MEKLGNHHIFIIFIHDKWKNGLIRRLVVSLFQEIHGRFLKTIGADAVGFSTVMETIAAVHAGMRVLGLSTITNINDPDHPEKPSVDAIIKTAENAVPKLDLLLRGIVEQLP